MPLVDEPVTSLQHGAVVTEQGIAWMWGRSEREQARNLIEHAAHPSGRDDLWEEARALGHELAGLSGALFAEPNPVVIKAVLAARGTIPSPAVRLPLLPASPEATAAALLRLP